jgi:hypothetical protein
MFGQICKVDVFRKRHKNLRKNITGFLTPAPPPLRISKKNVRDLL